ncbi:MAG: phosphatidylglycerophosphatase A [Candidatus Methylomirabilia bacterium]
MALFIATAGGVGYVPVVPGTAGSLLALAILWIVPFSPLGLALALLVLTILGGWASGRAERLLGRKDPNLVVVDEVAGMFLSVIALPRELVLFLSAFVLFRLLDILKPFPASRSESLPGGLGIMLDDLIAGAYTLALLWGLRALVGGSA